MDYLDNPERRSAGRLSDDASANHHGFGPAITHGAVPGRAVPDLDVWAALTSPSQFGGKGAANGNLRRRVQPVRPFGESIRQRPCSSFVMGAPHYRMEGGELRPG
jgi:hypothetical protein